MSTETLHSPIPRHTVNPISRLFRYYWGANIVERVRIVFCLVLAFVFTGFLEWIGTRTLIIIYGYLATYILGLTVCMIKDRTFWRRVQYVHVLTGFLTLYHLWGILVLDNKAPMLFEAFRSYSREMVTVYACAAALAGKKELRIFANGLQIGLILNALVSLLGYQYPVYYAFLVLDPKVAFNMENVGRYSGIFTNPNAASYVYVGCLFFSRWAHPRLALASRIFGLIALYLTFSRTSQYLLIIALILAVVRRVLLQWKAGDYKRVAQTVGKVGVGITVLMALVLANLDALEHNPKFQRFQNVSDQRRGYRGRFGVLADSVDLAMRGPWYGKGLFQFKEGITQVSPGVYVGAHNTYVLLLGEIGWINMLIYMGIIIYALIRSWRVVPDPEERYYISRYVVYILIVGATWHNLLIHLHGVLMVTFVFHVPNLFVAPKSNRQHLLPPPACTSLTGVAVSD